MNSVWTSLARQRQQWQPVEDKPLLCKYPVQDQFTDLYDHCLRIVGDFQKARKRTPAENRKHYKNWRQTRKRSPAAYAMNTTLSMYSEKTQRNQSDRKQLHAFEPRHRFVAERHLGKRGGIAVTSPARKRIHARRTATSPTDSLLPQPLRQISQSRCHNQNQRLQRVDFLCGDSPIIFCGRMAIHFTSMSRRSQTP